MTRPEPVARFDQDLAAQREWLVKITKAVRRLLDEDPDVSKAVVMLAQNFVYRDHHTLAINLAATIVRMALSDESARP